MLSSSDSANATLAVSTEKAEVGPGLPDSLAACLQLGGLFKVYSGCRSYCQNLLGSIFLSLLLRLWVCGLVGRRLDTGSYNGVVG